MLSKQSDQFYGAILDLETSKVRTSIIKRMYIGNALANCRLVSSFYLLASLPSLSLRSVLSETWCTGVFRAHSVTDRNAVRSEEDVRGADKLMRSYVSSPNRKTNKTTSVFAQATRYREHVARGESRARAERSGRGILYIEEK